MMLIYEFKYLLMIGNTMHKGTFHTDIFENCRSMQHDDHDDTLWTQVTTEQGYSIEVNLGTKRIIKLDP